MVNTGVCQAGAHILALQDSALARVLQNLGCTAHIHIPKVVRTWLGAAYAILLEGSPENFSCDVKGPGHILLVTLGCPHLRRSGERCSTHTHVADDSAHNEVPAGHGGCAHIVPQGRTSAWVYQDTGGPCSPLGCTGLTTSLGW